MGKEYKYMVATQCITYNQALYIEDTLNGFAGQKTTFPIVFVIVDDHSTDGEQKVIERWAENNLEKDGGGPKWEEKTYGRIVIASCKDNPHATFVILILRENHYQAGRQAERTGYISEWINKAKYQALCEGDDYWPVENKLQKQVDFLETHNDYVLVHSSYYSVDNNNRKIKQLYHFNHIEGDCFKKLLLAGNQIVTPSVCYRSSADEGWLEFRSSFPFKLKMGDKPHWLFLSKKGKFKYMKDVIVAYRELSESASHSGDAKKMIDFSDNGEKITLFINDYYNAGISVNTIKKIYATSRLRRLIKIDTDDYKLYIKKYLKECPSIFLSPKLLAVIIFRIVFKIKR